MKNFELSAGWSPGKDLSVQLVGYRATYEGIVEEVFGLPCPAGATCPTGTTSQFQNVGALEILGAQLEGQWSPGRYRFVGTYTYDDPQDTVRNLRVGDIADHRFGLSGTARLFEDRIDANLRLNAAVGRKTGKGTTVTASPYTKIDDYVIAGGAVTYRNLLVPGLDLQLSVENLLGTDLVRAVAAQPERLPDRRADPAAGTDVLPPPPDDAMRRREGVMGIARRVSSALGVRPGEGARVAALIGHSLFNGVFSAFFLTAANALFLSRFEISYLPLAYIAAAAVGYVAVLAFSKLEKAFGIGVLLVTNLAALLVLSGAFWFLARTSGSEWVVFAMFVCVGPMFSLIALGYWGLAGRLFDLRQGKRLFGLVGAGEEVSTIVGLFSIPFVIRFLGGPLPLVLIATVGLAGSLAIVVVDDARLPRDDRRERGRAGEGAAREGGRPRRPPEGPLLPPPRRLGHPPEPRPLQRRLRLPRADAVEVRRPRAARALHRHLLRRHEGRGARHEGGRLRAPPHQFGLKVGLLVLPVLLALCAGFGIRSAPSTSAWRASSSSSRSPSSSRSWRARRRSSRRSASSTSRSRAPTGCPTSRTSRGRPSSSRSASSASRSSSSAAASRSTR